MDSARLTKFLDFVSFDVRHVPEKSFLEKDKNNFSKISHVAKNIQMGGSFFLQNLVSMESKRPQLSSESQFSVILGHLA